MPEFAYDRHFVAFFDILAFSEIVNAEMTQDEAADIINFFNDALEHCREQFGSKWSWEVDKFSIKMFSDCICVSVPAKHENVDAFFMLIAQVQSIFVFNEIGLRGGVTVGRHYINEQMIFSAALVEAYKLEGQTKQPRIMVSDALTRFILDGAAESGDQIRMNNAAHFHRTYVMRDPDDDTLFLDYLNFMPAEDDGGVRLRQHRDWIVKNLKAHKDGSPGVLAKYQWLRGYHNRWCGIFEGHRSDLAELLVLS